MIYQSHFTEWTAQNYREYILFEKYANLFLQDKLDEFGIPSIIKEKFDFIKELAIETGFKIKDLFKLFLNKGVFKFFQLIKWSIKELFAIVKKGFDAYLNIQNAIAEYVQKNKIVQWTIQEVEKLDAFLQKHPKTKRIVGVAVAGFLIWCWLSMSFTGHPLDDFDITMVFASLTGKATLTNVFGTSSGIKMLMLLATGIITGVSFPYVGTNLVKFTVAVLVTLAKMIKEKLTKGNDVAQVTEKYKNKFKEYSESIEKNNSKRLCLG